MTRYFPYLGWWLGAVAILWAMSAAAEEAAPTLQPRLLMPATAPAPEAAPKPGKTRGLSLQGAAPVAELNPRLLPIPAK